MVKKIVFIFVLLVGALVIGISFYYYSATYEIAEYLALFTSVSTACYAILAQPKERTEPYLRVTPLLDRRQGSIAIGNYVSPNTAGIKIWIENVGYSNAINIELKCLLTLDTVLTLENEGIFKHPLLTPKEKVRYEAVESAQTDLLFSQKLAIEVVYSNEDGKKQKPINIESRIIDLEENLREVKTS
jgi:hypothetical protein